MTATLIQAPPYDTPAWVEWRRRGLGASDLPSVVGCDPWRTEYQLAAEKRGDLPSFEGNARTRWGHRMERIGIEVYQEVTGLHVVTGETFGLPEYPHLWATLDGRVADRRIGLEIKWSQGPSWSDGLPERVEVQALAQIGLADLDAVDIIRLPWFGEPPIRVERDDAAIRNLLELGEAWYRRFVLGDEMPPLDGSASALMAAQRDGPARFPATPHQEQLVGDLRRLRRAIERLERQRDDTVQAIKDSMAGGGVMEGTGFTVRWTPVKGARRTDWKALALAAQMHLDSIVWQSLMDDHTTTGEPTTRFLPTWSEEETKDGD